MQSSRVGDTPVFKMPAESHLIYLKPTRRGKAVKVSLRTRNRGGKKRAQQRDRQGVLYSNLFKT